MDFYVGILGLTERADRPDFSFDGAWLDAGSQQVHLIKADVPPDRGSTSPWLSPTWTARLPNCAGAACASPTRPRSAPGASRSSTTRPATASSCKAGKLAEERPRDPPSADPLAGPLKQPQASLRRRDLGERAGSQRPLVDAGTGPGRRRPGRGRRRGWRARRRGATQRRPALVVGTGPAASVWPPSMNSMPERRPPQPRHVGRPADDRDHVVVRGRRAASVARNVRQGVQPAGRRVDQAGVVVLPAGLVLLGAVVVVHRDDGLAGLRGPRRPPGRSWTCRSRCRSRAPARRWRRRPPPGTAPGPRTAA